MNRADFAVYRDIDIQYAHRVPGHLGKCAGLHGHRGNVRVCVEGTLQPSGPASGMILDFQTIEDALLQEIKARFCHRTILWQDDPFLQVLLDVGVSHIAGGGDLSGDAADGRIDEYESSWGTFVAVPCIPTAENLAYLCYTLLAYRLRSTTSRVVQVEFQETAKSVAVYPRGLR